MLWPCCWGVCSSDRPPCLWRTFSQCPVWTCPGTASFHLLWCLLTSHQREISTCPSTALLEEVLSLDQVESAEWAQLLLTGLTLESIHPPGCAPLGGHRAYILILRHPKLHTALKVRLHQCSVEWDNNSCLLLDVKTVTFAINYWTTITFWHLKQYWSSLKNLSSDAPKHKRKKNKIQRCHAELATVITTNLNTIFMRARDMTVTDAKMHSIIKNSLDNSHQYIPGTEESGSSYSK